MVDYTENNDPEEGHNYAELLDKEQSLGVEYSAEDNPTLSDFHMDDSFLRAIMGPVGSGKSVACSIEILRRSIEQEPNVHGIRRTKWAVVRNTYRELRDTTMATFHEWVPDELGRMRPSLHQFDIDFWLPDGTHVFSEVLFRALDTPADLAKLLSLEVTGAWFNEAREILWGAIDLMQTRVGRFPKLKYPDVGPTWNGIWIDTNPPDTDSKFYTIFEEIKPEGYKLYRQPSGVSTEAENTSNLIPNYYDRLTIGKSDDWVDVYVNAEYGFVSDGKPVFPEYSDQVHCKDVDFVPDPSIEIVIGIDFGLTPAATIGQQTRTGKWVIFDELVTEDMGAQRFGKLLNQKINSHYSNYTVRIFGDPAGMNRSETDEQTPFQILRNCGILAMKAPTNDQLVRFEAIRSCLTRMDSSAEPGFVVLPQAKFLRKSLRGGYCYKRMMVSGKDRYIDKPDKNSIYSHVNDSLQYLLCGAGEGRKVVSGNNYYHGDLSRSNLNKAVV